MGILFFARKNIKGILCLFALAGCIVMVICPEQSILSAQKGIILWANSIVPAMLPFFICINFIGGIGVLRVFPPGIFAFAMGIMSGYPMGPKIIGDMVRCNAVTHKKAVWLLSFCTLSGPAFMTATVGVSMLGDMKWGAVISASHYLAAMANCIIFFIVLRPSDEVQSLEYEQIKRGSLEIFTDSILQAFKSVGIILAYIIIFMFITDFMDYAGLFNHIYSPELKSVIKGVFEMTVGCNAITSYAVCFKTKVVLCSFFISFGGLSIIGQSMSMLAGTNIRLWYLLIIKVMQGAFAAVIAYFLCSIV